MTNEFWGQIKEELVSTIGRNNYVNWIEPLEFAALENGVARFHAPTPFIGDWVSRNYADTIIRELNTSGAAVSRVEFKVPRSATPAPAPKPAQPMCFRCTICRWALIGCCARSATSPVAAFYPKKARLSNRSRPIVAGWTVSP